jgi:hypothetical protein
VIYLSGAISKEIDRRAHRNVGFLITPWGGNSPPPNRAWAADNGCFTRAMPERDSRRWQAFVRRLQSVPGCLFLPAPDVWGNWPATLQLWRTGGRSRIVETGVPVAIVLQDGATTDEVPWDEIDAVFLGGSDAWRPKAVPILQRAKRLGKHVHVGRVNTWRGLLFSLRAGADTVDGTHLAYSPTASLVTLNSWLHRLDAQMALPLPVDPISE